VSGVVRFFEEDTEEFRSVFIQFIGDKPGGYSTSTRRLPLRAHYVHFSYLSNREQNMVIGRVVTFMRHWFKVNNHKVTDKWAEMLKEPIDYDNLAGLVLDPPAGMLPECKY
jgi:hypothetical protein